MEITTTQQLAEFMNVGVATVRRWIKVGMLPKPQKLGHKVFWISADIEGFLKRKSY